MMMPWMFTKTAHVCISIGLSQHWAISFTALQGYTNYQCIQYCWNGGTSMTLYNLHLIHGKPVINLLPVMYMSTFWDLSASLHLNHLLNQLRFQRDQFQCFPCVECYVGMVLPKVLLASQRQKQSTCCFTWLSLQCISHIHWLHPSILWSLSCCSGGVPCITSSYRLMVLFMAWIRCFPYMQTLLMLGMNCSVTPRAIMVTTWFPQWQLLY